MNLAKITFKLNDNFVNKYESIKPPFGFNGLGELTYIRTYSRLKDDGSNERWHETIRRVVEGCYSIQKNHITSHTLGWSEEKAQQSAEEMYDRMFNMKFLPAGRSLWAMGTPITSDKGLMAALFNCSFVSTKDIEKDKTKPFEYMTDMSMLGVGVGFDLKGADKVKIHKPLETSVEFTIPDTREGWVESIKRLLLSYMTPNSQEIVFDYSSIRPEGTPIKSFGGVSGGSKHLEESHNDIRKVLNARVGEKMTGRDIVDIMNIIGRCVVSGNVRRTAEIALGSYDDDEFIDLKNYEKNPDRMSWGWVSNNTVVCDTGSQYFDVARKITSNGEPGIFWLENARAFGRMKDKATYKDRNVLGVNPCFAGDQALLTVDGYQTFEDLSKKDNFLAYNSLGQKVFAKVFPSGIKETIALVLKNGRYIECTPNHLFKTKTGDDCEAKDMLGKITMGAWFDGGDDSSEVISIEKNNTPQQVYDFSLEGDDHWGYVNGCMVHNCGEISLNSFECCNLVETFPTLNNGLDDYKRTLKFAYLYGKTLTLCQTHWAETNRVQLANRRIGCGMSGIAQFIDKHGLDELRVWCNEGFYVIGKYDEVYSDWLAVPKSIKVTTVKPSGTLSLLAGVTPGLHFPESNYYIRRVRLSKTSKLVKVMKKAGYMVEQDLSSKDTMIVGVPVELNNVRTINDVSAWEQLGLAAFMQKYWADNQVSCTVTLKPNEFKDVPSMLEYFQYQLKGVSFLPQIEKGAYAQMPYEAITQEMYKELSSKITDINFDKVNEESKPEMFCTNDSCTI